MPSPTVTSCVSDADSHDVGCLCYSWSFPCSRQVQINDGVGKNSAPILFCINLKKWRDIYVCSFTLSFHRGIMILNLVVIPRDTVSSQGLLHLCLQNKAKNSQSLLYWELLICLLYWALFTVSHIPSLSLRLPASWFLIFIPGSFSVKCFSSIPVGCIGFPCHLVHNVSPIITVYGKFTLSSMIWDEDNSTLLHYLINTFYASGELLL